MQLTFDRVVQATEQAMCFEVGDDETVWVPISCIDNIQDFDPAEGVVEVKDWFAVKEGLV